MHMLRMSEAHRARLLADGVLAINARDEEILQGLSFDESQFMLDFDESPSSGADALDRHSELALKHEQARLKIATADDESSADEESRRRVRAARL